MKITKLIATTALILGAMQMHATAQVAGLTINVTARLITQSTNVFTNLHTQVVTVRPPVQRIFNTADMLKRLANDENLAGRFDGTTFPRGSRIVATNGGFFVYSGTNQLVDVGNVISIEFGTNVIFSGSTDTNGLARPSQTRTQIARFIFNDTSIDTTNGLAFYMQGILTDTITDSVPNRNTGVFVETETVSMPNANGEGNSGVGSDNPLEVVVSGTFTASGRGNDAIPL